jgi:decaprenylphospho-beta-D-erythro-pentofuranosid-2-ulose 2-reductase
MKNAVVILGARSTIAMAIAHEFAKNGHPVHLIARTSHEPDAEDMRIRFGVDVHYHELDLADSERFLDLIKGIPALGIVVSVLGRQEDETRTYTDVDYVQEIVAGNYSIPILTAELSASVLEEKGGGTFIGISSVAGDRGRQGNYLYGSAKAGYTAYLSGLRNKLGKTNTHVVTVRPGIIRTPLTSKQDFPPALMGEASTVAKDVYVEMQKKKNNIYTPWFWRWIMLVIRSVPEMLFKRLDL